MIYGSDPMAFVSEIWIGSDCCRGTVIFFVSSHNL